LGIIEQLIGARCLCKLEFVGTTCRCNDARAQRFTNLDRRDADAACRAEYEQCLARLDLRALCERVVARAIGYRKPGALFEVEACRQWDR